MGQQVAAQLSLLGVSCLRAITMKERPHCLPDILHTHQSPTMASSLALESPLVTMLLVAGAPRSAILVSTVHSLPFNGTQQHVCFGCSGVTLIVFGTKVNADSMCLNFG